MNLYCFKFSRLDLYLNSRASLIAIRAEVNRWFLATHCHVCQTSAQGLQWTFAEGTHQIFERLFTESASIVVEESAGVNFIAAHKGAILFVFVCKRRLHRINLHILRQPSR